MGSNPDIQWLLGLIDERIQHLHKLKESISTANGHVVSGTVARDTATEGTGRTRKQAIVELLRLKGPRTRLEIEQETKFPLGTIATVLNDKKTFRHAGDKKWALVDHA